MARFTVTLDVELDLDEWTKEYGTTSAARSLEQALSDLRDHEQYLRQPKWGGLAEVKDVKVHLNL